MMYNSEKISGLEDDYEIGKYQSEPKVLQCISLPVMERLLATYDCKTEVCETEGMPPCLRAKTEPGLSFSVNILDQEQAFISRVDQDGAMVVMGAHFDVVGDDMPEIDLNEIANRWNSSAFTSTACVHEGRLSVDYTIPAEGLLSNKFVSLVQEWFEIVTDFVKFVFEECAVGNDD